MARGEPDADALAAAIESRHRVAIPASVYLEFVLVSRGANPGRAWLDHFVVQSDVTIAPITERTARLAADAFERFGRGSGHPARLNFGDCLAYAAAREQDAALLFKGVDFAHTDVKRAL